ncbi:MULTISPECIES: undecaprenyl-diphosphatase [Cytobacillus]|uniref:Undecaprenyl-diphosphatase n=1 Tax=Cytobacillus kochii TaxID=859143 RepID=A0A248TNB7_9BACI|nr:undecaprenyl-diphosphatase [Cytobacillus kochii]ASV69580.1 undecaprenyl-diphosphatase [Cytobacillus kochii]
MNEINISLFRGINDLGFEYPDLNPIIVFIAEYTVILLALITLMYWFTRKTKHRYMVMTAGFTFILAEIIGKFVVSKLHFNYQPFVELDNVNQLIDKTANNSFPSDHTILFFSFCIVFWLFNKKNVLWPILSVLVGISRIWVGVHYPFDVITGALIAIICAIIMYNLIGRMQLFTTLLEVYEKIEEKVWPRKNKGRHVNR